MSLRWKLFRFLSTDILLSPSVSQPSDFDSSLFPSFASTNISSPSASTSSVTASTSSTVNVPSSEESALLSRFAAIADRSFQSHSYDALHAFALPRAVVHIFNLPLLRLSSPVVSSPSSSASPPIPSQLQNSVSSNPSNVQYLFPPQFSFSPHTNAVIATHFVTSSNVLPHLLTLGLDDSGATLKVWALHMRDAAPSSTTQPNATGRTAPLLEDLAYTKCLATHRIHGDARPTALAVTTSAQPPFTVDAAIGFHDGVVLLFTGDLTSTSAVSRIRVAPAPGEMIHARAIVALHYTPPLLYSVSETSIAVITPPSVTPSAMSSQTSITGKSSASSRKISFVRTVLDNLGVPDRLLTCALPLTRELVVAKPEALYFFNRDGRGPCLAFPTEGSRPLVTAVGSYIVHSAGTGTITAYDVANKLIAYRGKGTAICSFVPHRPAHRALLLCFSDGSIVKLSEISLDERVSMLLKRGLFVAAVALARSETNQVSMSGKHAPDNEILTKALRHYAEFLMSKERFDEAAEQLIETIGSTVEPSWVINRLVEQPGLRSGLRMYLEALHAAGRAAFVHTKVLITCYRHDRARGAILGDKASEKTTDEYVINVFSDVDWSEEQVDAAIRLCRNAGLFKVAERVARRRDRYVQLAETLVVDMGDADGALSLLKTLSHADAVNVILAVGRRMLSSRPEAFVEFLAEAICQSTAAALPEAVDPVLKLDTFLPLFIDAPQWRALLLQTVLAKPGGIPAKETSSAWLLLFESLVCVDLADRLSEKALTSTSACPRSPLLSASSLGRDGSTVENSEKVPRKDGGRALKILQNRWSVIDLRSAADIAEQYGHAGCLEYLYEHLRMYRELGGALRVWGRQGSLLKACRRHGEREPALWIEAIRLFAPIAAGVLEGQDSITTDSAAGGSRGEGANDGSGDYVDLRNHIEGCSAQDVLDEAMVALERSGTLSALEIIETVVDACPSGKWGIVREYFERWCSNLRRDAVNHEHSALVLEGEFRELEKEAGRLGEESVVIKGRVCALCEDTLRLPVIHFFCGHSYHLSCLAASGVKSELSNVSTDSDAALGGGDGVTKDGGGSRSQGMWGEDCPKCCRELDAMASMRQAIEERNQKHDEFFAALKASRDGFTTIVEFLERSPFL